MNRITEVLIPFLLYFIINTNSAVVDLACQAKVEVDFSDKSFSRDSIICFETELPCEAAGLAYKLQSKFVSQFSIDVESGNCLSSTTSPADATICMNITATDPKNNMITDQFEVCVVFNHPPVFGDVIQPEVINLATVSPPINITIPVNTEPDGINSFTATDVNPSSFSSYFQVYNNKAVVILIRSPDVQNVTDVYLNVSVTDDGQPPLSASKSFHLVLMNEEVTCDDTSTVYLDIKKDISFHMDCSSRADNTIKYSVSNIGTNPFTVSVSENGTVTGVISSSATPGIYYVSVTASTILGVEKTNRVALDLGNVPVCEDTEDTLILSRQVDINLSTPFTCYSVGDPQGEPSVDILNEKQPAAFDLITTSNASALSVTIQIVEKTFAGPNQLLIEVSNSYGLIFLTFNLARPPMFVSPQKEFTVLETIQPGTLIYTFTIDDPDPLPGTLSVFDTFDTTANIPFVMTGRNLSVTSTLNASATWEHFLTVKVTDTTNLTDVVNITIQVNDTNDAPWCNYVNDNLVLSVDRLRAPGLLTELACFDGDVVMDFKTLAYQLTSNSDELFVQYFGFTGQPNELMLLESLTNIVLPESSIIHLEVKVSDKGQPPLFTLININIQVFDNRPICNNSKITLEIGEKESVGACFNITHHCTDPTSDGLSFSFTSTNDEIASAYFEIKQTTEIVNVTFCIKKSLNGVPGSYESQITVANKNHNVLINLTLIVTDINEAPTFVNLPADGMFTVMEDASVGTTITTVSVDDVDSNTVSNGQYTLFVNALGEEIPGIMFNYTLQAFIVKSKLNAKYNSTQNTIYRYNVTAVDGGGLSASTTITIRVIDVNEAPQCSPETYSITVPVTSALDILTTIHCTDPDIQENYTAISYKIDQPLTEQFNISDKGELILAKALPLDQDQHRINVTVYNNVNEALSTSVTILLNVNREYPPSCDMTEAQTEFKDTDSTGTCSSNTVTCTSPVPGGLVMQVSGNMTDSIQVQMKNTTTGINIQVCVQAALRDSIGFFQVNISVENQVQRYEFLSWSVTVIDENEPPKFQQTTYDVTINETLTTGSTIVSLDIGKGLTFNDFDGKVIEVKDPDKYTDGYQIKAVDAAPYAFSKSDNSFVQLTDFPVGFSQSMFSVTGILDESLIYTFNITVEDGGGLLAVAVLKINVKDVNEAPTCTESSVTVNKTLLADEDRSVTRLMCTDPDYEDAYKITKYKLDGQDKDYFNISSKGVVVIAGALPRDKDVLNFNAVAVDGADPTLKYEVSIVIRVKRDIAATCLVQRNPPDTWVFNSCYNITLGCTDPTTSDSSTLAYQFSGNYTMGFVLTENNGDLVMCYTRTESGTYTINIVVDNGLKATSLNEVIEVQYERSTPKFENLSVKETVLYDVSVGSVLFTVTAVTTGTFAGNIIYLLLGESTPDTALNIFNVGRETGQIQTSSPLRDHIGQKFILKIEALDERSKLKTTASVEVTIDETNLQPKCPKNSEKDSININMIAAVGTVIATVNCTDSNILSKYNTLTYRATGPTNKYFAVDSETGEVSIADQLPFKDTHVLYIEASDSVFSDRTTLVINVDIKLKPTIEVVKVTTSSVKIRWTFERPDYTQYLVKYTIQWEAEGSISQNNVDRGISEYLLDSLKPGTVYFIILMSVAQGFNVSQAVTVKTKEIPVLSLFAVEFRVTDQEWSDAFLQNASAEYTEFKTKTELNIKKALKDVKGIHDVKVINMREGSVFVDSVISVNQSGNVNTTIKAMEMAIARGQVGDASVDPQFSSLYLGGQYVVITSLEVAQINPKEITEGLTLSVSCKARLVGQGLWPLFNWKLKGFSINADLSTRLNVTQSQQAKDRFGFTSVITFRPIKSTDKGSLECIVTDTTEEVKAASKSLLLDVISKPEVTLLPMTLYIKAGEVGTLSCSVETQTGYPVTITWSINNNTVTNIGAIRKDNYEVLNVTNINADARYRCHAKNIAGVVDSNIAIVGPITEEVFCAAFTDDRGISWPIMPAGKTAESQCVGSYKGNALRLCLSNGKWQNTTDLTNCKLELLMQLADKATAKKEGIDIGSTETIANTLANLTSKTLVSGDLDISIQIMEDVLYVNEKDPDKIIKTDEIKDFVMAADNMLSTSSMEWIDLQRKRKRGASALMKSLDTIGHLASQRAGDVNNSRERLYVHKNLVFEYGKSNATDIQFPRPDFSMYPPWMKLTQTKAFLKSSSYINALNGKPFMGYSGVCYKHMSKLMPGAKLHTRNRGSNSDTVSKMMNSLILSFSLNPRPTNTLDPPLELTFEHLSDNFSNPSCGFLDYSPPYETSGRWSSDGCVVVTKSINLTVCECDHFTNFAILMSPGRTPEKDAWILSIISAIGCAISIFCLVLTIGTYIVLWRYVKTERPDRVIILLNLCVVLIIAYLLFLLGVNRTENADVCTAISVLLHYFYLVVFFLMLAEGIELFVCVIYVFNMRSRLHWLMLMSWGIPAVIVGISLGATQLEGYGNETFCWLSLDNGLLWAFVGPALTVILINCIIVAVVLKTMLSTTAMMTKDAKEKGKAGLKALCVLLPVMGLTWVFGVFSVNENVVIFQYLFAVFNSVQGLFIFIFHCLLSRQVQDGMKNRKRRYLAPSHDTKSTYSQHNVPNKQMSDDTSGNSDMDKKLSPFLEVDRQVQQIAHKLAKVEKENFLDKEEQTKAAGTLDKVNVPTDLPEVKETNMQVLKPDIRRPSPQPVYQQQQTQTQQQLGHSAARQPPLSQEKRLGHRSLQQEASIEENMLQRSPVPQPYRKTVDGKEELKYSRGAAPPQRPVNHQADVKHMEGIIHTSQKRRDDIYNPLKQSKRDKHDYQDLQPRPAGQGHRLAGNSDNSLHEQKYKGCDLPLYIGQADDRWRKVKQAVEMKQFSDHPGPLRRPSQHQSEDDISRYGYYQPFGVPERRLPRTRFSDDDIRFEESFTDYHW